MHLDDNIMYIYTAVNYAHILYITSLFMRHLFHIILICQGEQRVIKNKSCP